MLFRLGAVEVDAGGNYLKLAEFINLDYAIRTDDVKYTNLAELWVRTLEIYVEGDPKKMEIVVILGFICYIM